MKGYARLCVRFAPMGGRPRTAPEARGRGFSVLDQIEVVAAVEIAPVPIEFSNKPVH